MARVREMGYEQWLHVVCREVVLHLARVNMSHGVMNNGCMLCVGRWCSTWLESTCSHGVMTPWLHVVCREVVLHLARVNMQPWCMNNGCMLCVGRWCSTWLESERWGMNNGCMLCHTPGGALSG